MHAAITASSELCRRALNAHELDARCAAATTKAFSVAADEVQRWIDTRRFSFGALNTQSEVLVSFLFSQRPSYSCVAMLGNHVRRHLWVAAQTAAQTLP